MNKLDFDLERDLGELFGNLPVAVTILDLDGKMIFYNDYAAEILVREPRFIGQSLEHCHRPGSTRKVEMFLETYRRGERRHFNYRGEARGKAIAVWVAPYVRKERVQGLIQAVVPLPPAPKPPA